MTHFTVNNAREPAARDFGLPSPPDDSRYDGVVPPLPPGPDPLDAKPYYQTRQRPEPGETWRSTETWPIKPMTLDNDVRSMPYQYNINPNLPIRDFSTNFPHTWIDYEKMYAAVYPDEPPMPGGYAPAPYAANELMRAIDEAMPHPWSSEENMTTDINGFGSLAEASGFAGMGQGFGINIANLFQSPETKAAETAVKEETEKAATPDIGMQILNFGAQIGSLYLQKRQLDALEDAAKKERATRLEIERLRLAQQRLAVEAARAGAGSQVIDDMKPRDEGVSPWVIGGGAVLATAAVASQVL